MSDELHLRFAEETPTPQAYNALRKAVGWGEYDLYAIEQGLRATHYCVCAYDHEKIIGMGRIIGDNVLVFYIQDIIVLPAYQGSGIGAQIMDRIMRYIDTHAVNHSIVGLMSAVGKEGFYEKYNFVRRPTDRLGCGMTIFIRE